MKSNRSSVRWQHWLSLVAVFSMLLTPVPADAHTQDDGVPPILTRASEAITYKEQTSPQVTVVTSGTNEIVLEASIPPVQFREVVESGVAYQRLYLPGTGTTTEMGKPELPTFGHFVAVPIGAKLQVEILEETPSVALLAQQGAYRIYPAQHPQTDQGSEPPFELDVDFYEEDALYPSETVTADEATTLRGINVTVVRFFPVQFNPARGQLRVFSRLRVRISFLDSSGQFVDQRLWSPHFENMYQQLLLNYPLLEAEVKQAAEVAASGPVICSANGADFLIITHPSFVEQANTLADWKRLRGIDTEVRTTTQTGTTANAIRNYILNAYNDWDPPPSFVLLMGDAEFIPPHYVTVHPWVYLGWYPPDALTGTDLYYADMTGNYYPELAIGRIPVNTAAEATTVINKIINYERIPPATANFYSSAMVAAFFQDYDGDHYSERRYVRTSEEIRDFLLTQGYSVDRVYYTFSGVTPTHYNNGEYGNGEPLPPELLRPGFAWDGWTNDIQSAINAGRFLVTHRGHGMSLNNSDSTIEGWLWPELAASDVADLTNGSKLPVVLSVNCETGWFDSETDYNDARNTQSLSEAFLLQPGGGAVGVIGATRGSFSGYNDFMIRGFIDTIWPNFIPDWGSPTPEYRMGQVLNLGKLSMVQFWGDPLGYQHTEFEAFHYFGDPTMEIWTAFPNVLSVLHPATLAEGSTSLTVDVAQGGALVSLVQDGEIIATATSSGGHATLNFNPVSIGLINVTVTKHNYVPYEGSVAVIDNDPPHEPSNPSPVHDATDQPVTVELSWTGGDPNGDSVVYDVYLETNNSSPELLVSDNQTGTFFDPGTLDCGTDYYWMIVAQDEHGATTSGDVWHFTTQACLPLSAPSNLNATAASQTQINLTWQDNSPDESDFHIERSPNGSTGWTEIATVEANVTSYNDTGLSCGTTYHYRVRAHRQCDGQYSGSSNVDSATTQACPPSAPSNLDATAASQTQINLTWQDNSSDESDFHIERSLNGSTGWTEIATVGADVTSYSDTGLSCGTTYYYRVRAHRHGDGQYSGSSNVDSATTQACPPLSAPSNLNATAASQTRIDLTWQDNSSDESDFHIERSPNGSTGWTEIATVGADVTSYNDTGLSCGTTYHYRVRAHRHGDGQYSGSSNVDSATTQACLPSAPSNLNATAASQTQINLTWQDNSSDESDFHIERSPNGSTGWTEIATVGADVTSYSDTGLSCGTTYYYRVRAHRHSDGQYSSYSNIASFTTLSCAWTVASFPFYDGFESGGLDTGWSIYITNEGRVRVATAYPYAGSYSLLLDDYQDGGSDSYAAAILTIDLSGQTDAVLDFWWREFADENDPGDGVFISDDNGTNWYQVFSFNNGPSSFRRDVVDIGAAAVANGLTLNDHFQIKFQFYDNDPVNSDGYAIDEVRIEICAVPSVPGLFSPSNGSSICDTIPTFSWGRLSEATSYRIQVDNDSSFSSPETDQTISSTSYTMGSAMPDGTYYWRVQASNSCGGGLWSSIWSFAILSTPAAPNLFSPSNGGTISDNTPTFGWGSVSGATSYHIQVDNNFSFSSPEIDQTTSSMSYTPDSALLNGIIYYWRVQASNACGNGAWSEVWTFITPAPAWHGGKIYLSIIMKSSASSAPAPGPDLIVERVIATSNSVQVVIKNQGDAPVTDAFWVDVYFNPSVTPSLNQPWDTIASHGVVWGITTTIQAGDVLTLTTGGDYYFPDLSSPAPLPVGADVYALVDSINFDTTYGAVLESDEGNNLSGPVTSTASVAGEVLPVVGQGQPLSREGLPPGR